MAKKTSRVRLPQAYPLPGLRTLGVDEEGSRIWEILEEAGARPPFEKDAESDSALFNNVSYFACIDRDLANAVRDYVAHQWMELRGSNAAFREELLALRAGLAGFPGDLRAGFVWSVVEQLMGEDSSDQFVQLWEEFKAAVAKLSTDERVGQRTGAPPKRAKHELLSRLRGIFRIWTGHDPAPGSKAFLQFEDFATEVEDEMLRWLTPRLAQGRESNRRADWWREELYRFTKGIASSFERSG